MVRGNGRNQFRHFAGQNVRNQNRYNATQNVRNQVVPNAVQNLARAEGNGNQNNEIRYGVTSAEEWVIMLGTALSEHEEGMLLIFRLNQGSQCKLYIDGNLQQASTSGTQTDKAPVYDSNGSAEVHEYDNYYNNEIFYMFTQDEQYTELLELIFEPHKVQQNDSNVISAISSVEQSERTVEQHPTTIKKTHALYDSLYNNLAIKVEKVNTVNRKMKETNAESTTELARYKNKKSVLKLMKINMINLKGVIKSLYIKSSVLLKR
nr:hypothetical protein [Tanacetum cinerariifolium]